MSGDITRRQAIGLTAAGALSAWALAGCGRGEGETSRAGGAAGGALPESAVTLYCAVDDFIARPIIARFESETDIKVRMVTDTEATKAVGLVQRIRGEAGGGGGGGGADVWWAGEPMSSVDLASAGVLEAMPESVLAPAAPGDEPLPEDVPRDPGLLWVGCAERARVLVVRRNLEEARRPRTLQDLARTELRVAIAQPQFGSTRSHFAALVLLMGEGWVREYLTTLRARGVKLLPGNSAVVRAVAQGEADVGLTDTDDVWVAQDNGWEVDALFPAPAEGAGQASPGVVLFPATVALLKGGRAPTGARRLASYLLSAAGERAMAQSAMRTVPVRAQLREELAATDPRLRIAHATRVDWTRVAREAREPADALIRDVFPV